MEYSIELTGLQKKGFVRAEESTLLINDFIESEKYPVIRYEVQFQNEKIVLYKLVSTKDWFFMPINNHVPEYLIKHTMDAIDKYEKDNNQKF